MSNISQPQLVTLKRLMGLLAVFVCAKLLQSCPTLYNHVDCTLLGSSVPAILQARILEWVAVPFSRGSS